jgi:quercetin dioxygenase-like cupin family protein
VNSKDPPETTDPLAGVATLLSTLVEYQEHSVVSRTLIHKGRGTLFAFDSGQGLSEHTTSCDARVYVVEGKCEITVSGTAHVVEQGEVPDDASQSPTRRAGCGDVQDTADDGSLAAHPLM